jgi:hypothetical protein
VLRALRASGVITILVLSILGPGALVAAGDDGPPRTRPADRPTRTVLRPAELPDQAPPIVAKQSDKIVIMLVSGIGSDAPDNTFDSLISALDYDPRYEIHRFGGDPAHPYDSRGSLDANADQLTAEVRELAKTHPKIEIVAHSMGGDVVDAAFRRGLSASDKVETYIALAAPHNGSTEARYGQVFLRVSELLGAKTEFRAITAGIKEDAGSRAALDLATVRAGPPPAGVTRFDLRIATDAIVTAPDARTPNVVSRTLLPSTIGALEGHGGVTTDPFAIELVAATVASGRAPAPDTRGTVLQAATGAVSDLFARLAPAFYVGALCLMLCGAVGLAVYRRFGRVARLAIP